MATLTQLHYIVTVDRLKHFGRAAEACHVSQPSLSMQIQKVEDEVGYALFDRLKKPIVPTEKGQAFIEQARLVLRESAKLEALTRTQGQEISGEFRLGVIPTLTPYLLPLFLEPFSRQYPKVRLTVDELKTESIIQELRADQLDAAIMATPLGEPGLHERNLFYEPFHLYVSREHPLHSRKRIREDDLDGSDMWLLQDGHCLRSQVVRLCSLSKNDSVLKNVRFQGGNLETLIYLVRRSRGYTLIPQLLVNALSAEERRQFVRDFESPAPSREVSLVYRRDLWKSDILSALEKTLKESLPGDLKDSLDRKRLRVIKVV